MAGEPRQLSESLERYGSYPKTPPNFLARRNAAGAPLLARVCCVLLGLWRVLRELLKDGISAAVVTLHVVLIICFCC